MNLSPVLKGLVFEQKFNEEDSLFKNRLNRYLKTVERSWSSNLSLILKIGIVFQSVLLLMQSNQRISLWTFIQMVVHYTI
jgi:hypothetical protein